MSSVVLDASAVLAVINKENGHEKVTPHLSGGLISAVNYSEVLKKAVERGVPVATTKFHLDNFMLEIIPFDAAQAMQAAEIWPAVKAFGLSFADRACLVLGMTRATAIVTADSRMAETDLSVRVSLIRGRR